MARMIKLVSVDPKWFKSRTFRASTNTVDIIPPISWDANTASGTVVTDDYLGNPIVSQRPFQSRGYTFNWIGTHKEINTILQVIARSSNRYFLLGDLAETNIITPTMMYDSRAMLASAADNYKMPGESYQPYLTVNNSETWNPGSYGVKVSDYAYMDYENSASAYIFVPGTQTLTVELSPVGRSSDRTDVLNNIDFTLYVKTLGTAVNTVHDTELSKLNDSFSTAVTNAIVRIDMKHPLEVTTSGDLKDILNYIPPKISLSGSQEYEYGMPDIPSLLTPINDYVYNILSPNLAELSMNFQEVSVATN